MSSGGSGGRGGGGGGSYSGGSTPLPPVKSSGSTSNKTYKTLEYNIGNTLARPMNPKEYNSKIKSFATQIMNAENSGAITKAQAERLYSLINI